MFSADIVISSSPYKEHQESDSMTMADHFEGGITVEEIGVEDIEVPEDIVVGDIGVEEPFDVPPEKRLKQVCTSYLM